MSKADEAEVEKARELVVRWLDEDYRTRAGVVSTKSLDRLANRIAGLVNTTRAEDGDADRPGAPAETLKRVQPAILKGCNPTARLELGEQQVDDHRRFDCPSYETCLTYACHRRWWSFSCEKCEGPR